MRNIENPYLRCHYCDITEAELGGPGDINYRSTPSDGDRWVCLWCEEEAMRGRRDVTYDPDPRKAL